MRDIAFDAVGRLYFSEATGGGGNGKIWRLDGGTASLYVDVLLAKIGGFWVGDFAFAPTGHSTLFDPAKTPWHVRLRMRSRG